MIIFPRKQISNHDLALSASAHRRKAAADALELAGLAISAGTPKKTVIVSIMRSCGFSAGEARKTYQLASSKKKHSHD